MVRGQGDTMHSYSIESFLVIIFFLAGCCIVYVYSVTMYILLWDTHTNWPRAKVLCANNSAKKSNNIKMHDFINDLLVELYPLPLSHTLFLLSRYHGNSCTVQKRIQTIDRNIQDVVEWQLVFLLIFSWSFLELVFSWLCCPNWVEEKFCEIHW